MNGNRNVTFQGRDIGDAVDIDFDIPVEVDPDTGLATASLSGAFAAVEEPPEVSVMLQRERLAKGGAIGIGPTKAAVAFRFDDYEDQFGANIYPLMVERGMPASRAQISRPIGRTFAGPCETTTWDDIVEWTRNGMEVWCHGATHGEQGIYPAVYDDATLIDEIVTPKAEIIAATGGAVKVVGYTKAGLQEPPGVNDGPMGTNFFYVEDMHTTRAGRLIFANYPISEGLAEGAFRPIPAGLLHAVGHYTLGEGTLNLAAAKVKVDQAIERGWGVEFMAHAGDIMAGAVMGIADFEALLDYVVAKWDAGLLEVLTPSGLMFADRTDKRLDLLKSGNFQGVNTGSTLWEGSSWTAGQTVEQEFGTGRRFMRIPSGVGYRSYQWVRDLQELGVAGEAFVFEGKCRSNGAGTTTPVVVVTDSDDNTRLAVTKEAPATGTSWTTVRSAFTLHPDTDKVTVALGRNAGDGIDWADLHVWKV